MRETLKTNVSGHVLIKDRSTGEVLRDEYNAIHPKNMATVIARGLSNAANGTVFKMKLGNQGTFINTSQQIEFRSPITVGDNANLYNQTWVEIVDDGDVSVSSGNSVTFTNIPSSSNTRVIVTAVISSYEAADNASDTNPVGGTTNPESRYFFDELGLFTKGTGAEASGAVSSPTTGELMLSHLIFSPIEHTGNRELVIVYTLTISVS